MHQSSFWLFSCYLRWYLWCYLFIISFVMLFTHFMNTFSRWGKCFPRKHAMTEQHILLKCFLFILNWNIYCIHHVIKFSFCLTDKSLLKLSTMEHTHNPNAYEMEGRSYIRSKSSLATYRTESLLRICKTDKKDKKKKARKNANQRKKSP